jgi:hypothetical protein
MRWSGTFVTETLGVTQMREEPSASVMRYEFVR